MEEIVKSVMFVVFPILMYLVFSCYNVLANKKIEKIIFIITMCTSLYLSLSIDNYSDNLLLFCNIPVLICYFKKQDMLGVILSLLVILFSYIMYDVNIYIVILKYFSYFIAYLFLSKRKDFNSIFLKISAVIQGFFISFEYFMNPDNGIDKVVDLIIYIFVIYAITFFCLYLFKLADNITSLYLMVNKINEENKLKNSLFKLTHEIKNPIAVCKGYLDMINLSDIDKSKRYINIVKSEIDRSLNVMSDFMEYSKIKVNKEIFDMVILMDDIYESFNILVRDKNICFNYHNKYDEVYVWGDYERLKQVFVNIIKNSIESIQGSGIINIDVSLGEGNVLVSVSDTGVGMSSDELLNVKEMFWTTKRNGTGLGVALSNEIVLAHGGEINYESEVGKGTICNVKLPL